MKKYGEKKRIDKVKQAVDFYTKSIDIIDKMDADIGGAWAVEEKALLEMQTLKSLFYSEDWVFITVDLYASSMSSMPLKVYKSVPMGEEIEKKALPNHLVQSILDTPNKFQDKVSWVYNMAVEHILMGNVVQWWQDEVKQFVIIPSETVIINGKEKTLDEIEYFITDREGLLTNQPTMKFSPNQISHVKRSSPNSVYWGLSPFIPVRRSTLFNRYTGEYLNSFYQKQATPGMVIEVDKNINEEQALRLLRSFELAYTGRRNQRRTMVLPKGTKASSFVSTISDQKLVDLVNMNRETILQATKTPKHAVGLQKTGSLGSQEHKEALKWYWQASVMPGAMQITAELTRFFRAKGMLAEDESIEADSSEVEILRDDKLKKAELATSMLSTRTFNEVRKEVWNEEPIEGGDVVRDIEQLKPPPPSSYFSPPAPESESQKAIDVVTLDPHIEENKAIVQKRIEGLGKLFKDKPEYAAWIEAQTKSEDSEVDKKKKELVEMNLEFLVEAAVSSIEAFKRETTKDSKPKKVTLKALKRSIKDSLDKLKAKYVEDNTALLEETLDLGYDSKLSTIFNTEDRRAVEALKERDEEGRQRILEARSIETFKSIQSTTTDQVMREISKGFEENLTITEIQKNIASSILGDPNIENVFEAYDKGLRHAETIARTETLTAVSVGQFSASKNMDEVIGDMYKVWINAGDIRVRANPAGPYAKADNDHWTLQGEAVPFDKPFSNGLMYPRDVKSNEAGEIINCRCTWLDVPKEDLESYGITNLHLI